MKNPKESYICWPQNTIRILQQNDFRFNKKFGQNFLIDPHVAEKIARAAELGPADTVVEIGPGLGSLTQLLAEEAGRVIAVEIDRRLIPILEQNLGMYENITIVEADFMELDLPAFLAEQGVAGPVKIVANLPYYITTPILEKIFESGIAPAAICVMVQEEAARRMQAAPGSKDYGSLSLEIAFYADSTISAFVPPNCFMPRPGVGSAVITLRKLPEPRVSVRDRAQMFAIIKAALGQRRKTLANSLSGSPEFSIAKEDAQALIAAAGIGELCRGETLTLEEFARLSDLWTETLALRGGAASASADTKENENE